MCAMKIKPYTTVLIQVSESSDTLLQQSQRTNDASYRNALLVLYLVATGEGHTLTAIASKLRIARKTVKTILQTYREGSLNALKPPPPIQKSPVERVRAVPQHAIEQLRTELSNSDSSFRSYEDTRSRLEELSGHPVKYNTGYRIVKQVLKAKLKRPRPSNIKKNATREQAIKKKRDSSSD